MNDNPCVDLSNLREMTDGDTELEAELFQEFITSSQELLEELKSQYTTHGDNETWQKTAHALKGISINLGAMPLGDLAKDAQENYDHSYDYKHSLFQKIEAAHKDVLNFLAEETGNI